MSQREDEPYYSDEELRKLVDQLNALTDELGQWNWTQARVEHEDLFGDTIRPGEDYLKREYGPVLEHVKLSKLSMSKMLFALFEGNVRLQTIAERLHEHIKEDREQRARKAVNRLYVPPASSDL